MPRKLRNIGAAAPDARLLTRSQVAGRFGVSVVTIDRWTKRGILRPVELFDLRRVLFSADDVDRLISEQSCRRVASA